MLKHTQLLELGMQHIHRKPAMCTQGQENQQQLDESVASSVWTMKISTLSEAHSD